MQWTVEIFAGKQHSKQIKKTVKEPISTVLRFPKFTGTVIHFNFSN